MLNAVVAELGVLVQLMYICIYIYTYLKAELWISDSLYFHWFNGYWLSGHIPAVPNMARNASAIKRAKSVVAALRKKWLTEAVWTGIRTTWKSCHYSTGACWV